MTYKVPKAKDLSKFKHPPESLKEVLAKVAPRKTISKQFTAMKAADPEGSVEAGIMIPNEEQLAKINSFTRSPKTADDIVVFPTLSCNDIIDRDYDRFTTETVREFAKLPEPYGPVGKSFMVGHDYNKLPVGRIFDADTKVIDGDTYLTNWVYLPNTEANKSYIENVDHGVYWAVSVGVLMGAADCTVGDPHPASGWFACSKGHIKGYYYEPDGEVDDWGWPEPVDENTKGAQLATVDMYEPKDFYELSQVFLGAQYMAQLDEKSSVGGIIKAASAAGEPFVPLGANEAKELPLQHVPEEVRKAFENYEITRSEEGTLSWVDSEGLIRSYHEQSDEVLCLGKKRDADESSDNSIGLSVAPEVRAANADTAQRLHADGVSREQKGREPDTTTGSGARVFWPGRTGEQRVDDAPSASDTQVSESAVLAAARAAGVSAELIEKAAGQSEDLLTALVSTLQKENDELKALKPLAEIGQKYADELRSKAVDWYVRARQDPSKPGPVKTATFERMLKLAGDDVDLIKGMLTEQEELAHERYPAPVRRSTTPQDPTEIKGGGLEREDLDTSAATKLHG